MVMGHYSVRAAIIWPCCNIVAMYQSFDHAAIVCLQYFVAIMWICGNVISMLQLCIHSSTYGHAAIVWPCCNSLAMQQNYGHATLVRLCCNTYSHYDRQNDRRNDILNESVSVEWLKQIWSNSCRNEYSKQSMNGWSKQWSNISFN
jgi:hypothetical protein